MFRIKVLLFVLFVGVSLSLLFCGKDEGADDSTVLGPASEPEPENISLTDIDDNSYKVVKIGDQWWMAENLNVTHYRNGDAIPNVTDNEEWANLKSGAYCDYNNDQSQSTTYGHLYNCYAIADNRGLAPEGWHVSTHEDWKTLQVFLGMSQDETDKKGPSLWLGTDEGGKMKEADTTHWSYPNNGATNSSGFTALPAGYRYHDLAGQVGEFSGLGGIAYFWAYDPDDNNHIFSRCLRSSHSQILQCESRPMISMGHSIRCVKDE